MKQDVETNFLPPKLTHHSDHCAEGSVNLLVDRKAQDVNINVVLLGGAVTLARVYLFFLM